MILQAFSLSLSAKITKLPSDSPGSLSLSCQSHQTSFTTKLQISHVTQLQPTLTCSSVVVTHFSTLTTTTRNPIAYICQIYHTAMGHRYFNLAMTCDICLRYAHASHKSASAFRSPTLWDDHGTLPWCLVGSHSDEHLQATAKAIPWEQAQSVSAEINSSLSPSR